MSELSIKKRLNDAKKQAMRDRDAARKLVITAAIAEIQRIEVDERIDVDCERALVVLDKMLKQRRDALSQFEAAGRNDLSEQEAYEIGVLQDFLPAQLNEAEIKELIQQGIEQTGAESMKDMGKLMGVLRPQFQGRADMAAASKLIKAALA